MAHVAINIEGGLISGDLLEKIATIADQKESSILLPVPLPSFGPRRNRRPQVR
jgi:hypothetical protein